MRQQGRSARKGEALLHANPPSAAHIEFQRDQAGSASSAFAFFALAAYTIVGSTLSLTGVTTPESSNVGIVLAAVSVVVMPFLSVLERRTGRELGSATVVADSKQTLICSLLSAAVLLGLVANAAFGWTWADALAALVIGAFAIREGIEAWNGDTCATAIGELMEGSSTHEHDHDHDHDEESHP